MRVESALWEKELHLSAMAINLPFRTRRKTRLPTITPRLDSLMIMFQKERDTAFPMTPKKDLWMKTKSRKRQALENTTISLIGMISRD